VLTAGMYSTLETLWENNHHVQTVQQSMATPLPCLRHGCRADGILHAPYMKALPLTLRSLDSHALLACAASAPHSQYTAACADAFIHATGCAAKIIPASNRPCTGGTCQEGSREASHSVTKQQSSLN
jgi:hypothetical protein